MIRRRATAALAVAGVLSIVASSQLALAGGGKHAAMMIDANSGEVLHDEDGDAPRHPASLTKMMTLYMTFEALESGRLKMSSRVPISEAAASAQPSKLDLDPGDDIAVGDAIRALITKSANDVAIALAESIGGSERGFVKLMNQRARDIGMTKTNFENASGLPDVQQVTTARDMITLGLRLQDDFPAYYPMFASRSFTYAGKTLRNHNTLLNSFQGADGIKTGYTRMSGFNLVSSVRRGGRHVVGAVFGGASSATRNGEMRILLSKALTKASLMKTRKPAPLLIAKIKTPPKLVARPALKPTVTADEPVKMAAASVAKAEPRPAPKPFAAPKPIEAAVDDALTPDPQAAAVAVAEAAAKPAPIEVYKVKRIAVMPRAKPAAPVDPDATTDMTMEDLIAAATGVSSAVAAEPKFVTASATAAPHRASFATASVDAVGQETSVAKLAPAVAASDAAMSMLGAGDVAAAAEPVPAPIAAVAETAVVEDEPGMLRGFAPSTLADQAASLGASRQRVAALAPTKPAKKSGRYEVQIGAFDSADEAKRKLADVKTRTGSLLDGATPVTQPTKKADRTMYRARFAGFDADRAAAACSDLRRQSIDCFVMTAE